MSPAYRFGVGLLGFLGAVLGLPAPSPAQENFEIQVYGSETVAPGALSAR